MTLPPAYLPTGVAGLDTVLGSGLPAHALVFIVGTPGAGKTILASQIVFQTLQTGASALILTAFSEGHVKLLEHLRPLAFFDEALVGQTLTLLSLQTLIGPALDQAATILANTIRAAGARVVLIDGFQGIRDLFAHSRQVRRMLADLAILLTYLDVTLLVTLEGDGRDRALTKELTTADVVLGLRYRIDGLRHARHLEVIKQRGHAPLAGLHPYTITAQGLTVFPRLEARGVPPARPRPVGRVLFGLPELDALLGGGPNAGTSTVLAGAPGVGKTSLGLIWALAAATPLDTSVFLTFDEQLPDLALKADFLGLPLRQAQTAGAFRSLHLSPVDLNPDELAARLLATLTPTTQRVVIDNVRVIAEALGARTGDFLAAVRHQLYAAGVTSLLLLEVPAFAGFEVAVAAMPVSLLADNMVIVQQVVALGALRRVVAVLKMRYSGYDGTLRELQIDEQGVHVLTPPQSANGVLTAVAAASDLTAPFEESPPA